MELVGETAGYLQRRRHDDDAIGLGRKAFFIHADERRVVKTLIIVETDVDMEIPSGFHGLAGAFFYLLPISLGLMLGQNDLNLIGFVVSQCACIHVGLIVHFLQRFLYFLAG